MARAQTIQIHLPTGNPAGIRIASITTRTVRVFEVPRPLLKDFLGRREASQVGVYYLFGDDTDGAPKAYIGQSGNVGARLQQHAASPKKEFWTKAMVAVSLTNEWTSTHVAYIEGLSIDRASKADRYALQNGNQASNPHTPEPLEADCFEYLETIAVLLATLGEPILEPLRRTSATVDATDQGNVADQLFFHKSGCEAAGYMTPEGMLVCAGSKGRPEMSENADSWTIRTRESLQADGVVTIDGAELVFVKDHLFKTPGGAGAILIGRRTQGREGWKNAAGLSINQIEALALSEDVPAGT